MGEILLIDGEETAAGCHGEVRSWRTGAEARRSSVPVAPARASAGSAWSRGWKNDITADDPYSSR